MQVTSPLRRILEGFVLCSICTGAALPRASAAIVFPPPDEIHVQRVTPATSLGSLEADVSLLRVASDVARFFRHHGRLESFRIEDLETYLRQQYPAVQRVTGTVYEYRYVVVNGEIVRVCYRPVEIVIGGEGDGGDPVALSFELTMPI